MAFSTIMFVDVDATAAELRRIHQQMALWHAIAVLAQESYRGLAARQLYLSDPTQGQAGGGMAVQITHAGHQALVQQLERVLVGLRAATTTMPDARSVGREDSFLALLGQQDRLVHIVAETSDAPMEMHVDKPLPAVFDPTSLPTLPAAAVRAQPHLLPPGTSPFAAFCQQAPFGERTPDGEPEPYTQQGPGDKQTAGRDQAPQAPQRREGNQAPQQDLPERARLAVDKALLGGSRRQGPRSGVPEQSCQTGAQKKAAEAVKAVKRAKHGAWATLATEGSAQAATPNSDEPGKQDDRSQALSHLRQLWACNKQQEFSLWQKRYVRERGLVSYAEVATIRQGAGTA